MRVFHILFASALLAGTAQAQVISPLTGSTGTPARPDVQVPAAQAASAPRGRRTLAQRYDAANITHDGKLTLSQARAGRMNAVARDFAAIDSDHKGYVTLDEIRAHTRAMAAARRANRAQ